MGVSQTLKFWYVGLAGNQPSRVELGQNLYSVH
jgi:hypothetical protein